MVAVREYNIVFADGEMVEVEVTETEADVIQKAPMGSDPGETAANTVATPRETGSRGQKGPVCIPPSGS
ncbi:hypothetical protein PG985_011957 [Apiospora marii]|uniref:uncharacterized protein n=1 Tax=Apiospora marii TaxID=335849 RepID=UPI00312FFBEF